VRALEDILDRYAQEQDDQVYIEGAMVSRRPTLPLEAGRLYEFAWRAWQMNLDLQGELISGRTHERQALQAADRKLAIALDVLDELPFGRARETLRSLLRGAREELA